MLLGLNNHSIWYISGLLFKTSQSEFFPGILHKEKCYLFLLNSKAGMMQVWNFQWPLFILSSILGAGVSEVIENEANVQRDAKM